MFVLIVLLVLNSEVVDGASTGMAFQTHEECSAAGVELLKKKPAPNVVFVCELKAPKGFM